MNKILIILLFIIFTILYNQYYDYKYEHMSVLDYEGEQTISNLFSNKNVLATNIVSNNTTVLNSLILNGLNNVNGTISALNNNGILYSPAAYFPSISATNTIANKIISNALTGYCLNAINMVLGKPMYYSDASNLSLYDNIGDAPASFVSGSSAQLGITQSSTFDNTTYGGSNKYGGYSSAPKDLIYKQCNATIFTTNKNDSSGCIVNLPVGHSVIWLKLFNDTTLYAFTFTAVGTNMSLYYSACSNQNLRMHPSGSIDNSPILFKWTPFVILGPNNYDSNSKPIPILITPMYDSSKGCGTSWGFAAVGIATSTNPWSRISIDPYILYCNMIPYGLSYNTLTASTNNSNSNIKSEIPISPYDATITLGKFSNIIDSGSINWFIPHDTPITFNIYVINNGFDKMLYFINTNTSFDTSSYGYVIVNGITIPRMKTTYRNVFSTHYNTKTFNKYVATIIPYSIIQNSTQIGISMAILQITVMSVGSGSASSAGLYLTEIGTHDIDAIY